MMRSERGRSLRLRPDGPQSVVASVVEVEKQGCRDTLPDAREH